MSSWLTSPPQNLVTSNALSCCQNMLGKGLVGLDHDCLLRCGWWWGGSAVACAVVLFSFWCRKSQQIFGSTESIGQGEHLHIKGRRYPRGWGRRTGCHSKVCPAICGTWSWEADKCPFSPVAEMLACKNWEKYSMEEFQQGLATFVK